MAQVTVAGTEIRHLGHVNSREELPGRKATQQSFRRPAESLNGAAVLWLGYDWGDKTGGPWVHVLVYLGTEVESFPDGVEFLPGSVADGCWIKNCWSDGWTNCRVFTIPAVIPIGKFGLYCPKPTGDGR